MESVESPVSKNVYFQLDVESISWVSSYLCCNIFELRTKAVAIGQSNNSLSLIPKRVLVVAWLGFKVLSG